MKVWLSIALLVATVQGFGGASGSFAGTVIDGPDQASGWVYVEGRNHSVRRVNISAAKVRYESDVPKAERKNPVPRALPAGTHVRVTAEQDESGEWRAEDVEILSGADGPDEKKDAPATTSQT